MADLKPGDKLGSNYQITGIIGIGGMGRIYSATQAKLNREVAIKVVRPDGKDLDVLLKRFEREAAIVGKLQHPHVLKVFDYGTEDGLVYLVMEWQKGGNLSDLLGQGILPLPTTVKIFEQLASALDYTHQQGIIHRDLKPENILLDAAYNVYLTDFGIAKVNSERSEHASLTLTGATIGTPSYMSPEQWQGTDLDNRADIYAMGIVLFEMLSGKLPFTGDTPFALMHKHINESLVLVAPLRAGLPSVVDKVLQKALAKDRAYRFTSANEFAEAFKLALKGETPPNLEIPVVAPANPTPPRLSGRVPLVAIAALAVLVVLVGLGGLALSNRPTPTTIALAATNNITPAPLPLNAETLAAQTLIPRQSATALQMTVNAIVATAERANITNTPTASTIPSLAGPLNAAGLDNNFFISFAETTNYPDFRSVGGGIPVEDLKMSFSDGTINLYSGIGKWGGLYMHEACSVSSQAGFIYQFRYSNSVAAIAFVLNAYGTQWNTPIFRSWRMLKEANSDTWSFFYINGTPDKTTFVNNVTLAPETWYYLFIYTDGEGRGHANIWPANNATQYLLSTSALPDGAKTDSGDGWTTSRWCVVTEIDGSTSIVLSLKTYQEVSLLDGFKLPRVGEWK
jgi:serine/threonine protein kinase